MARKLSSPARYSAHSATKISITPFRLKRLLPGYRLREDLHARSIAGVVPGGMHNTVGSGNELVIVAKETAARETDARIKRSVADSHLLGERLTGPAL